jgi:hypothetical protein
MRKARRSVSIPLSVKLPSKRVREKFLVTYELEGCQKAVNFLAKYYKAKPMKIVFNGRKVCKGCIACYESNKAYFKRKGLEKRTVLHELYHHLIDAHELDLASRIEEKEANIFARKFRLD